VEFERILKVWKLDDNYPHHAVAQVPVRSFLIDVKPAHQADCHMIEELKDA